MAEQDGKEKRKRAGVRQGLCLDHGMDAALRFPPGFLWGAATAAHQIEGHNTASDWWRSEQLGLLPHQSGAACDSWNRWPEDVRLLRDLGLNAYRLSVEWARVEPEPGRFDQAALDTYRRQMEALREAGVEPLVTLHHFTNPQWLVDQGGWRNPDVVGRLAAYADRVGRALGDQVRWWVSINEPSILGLKSYLEGAWPPHTPYDLRGYLRFMRHAARGHAAMRRALRAHRPDAQVSLAFALWPMEPHRRWHPGDQAAVWLADWFWQGRILWRTLPHVDWVGVNYYTRVVVAWPPPRKQAAAATDPHAGSGERTDFGWEIYPPGLYNVLRRVGQFGKPVMITENGVSDAADRQRARYLVQHLEQVHRAIEAGVDVRGYMHWSLMDNFEWADGYTQRFGLVAVDFATGERTPRPSAGVYGEIARANALTPEARRIAQPSSR